MFDGDSFRRQPGLLERLMVEGGLEEMSIHLDTTMCGRTGSYKNARTEVELNPLREEIAEAIREARLRTGLPLIAATTMTVTRENLEGVADAVRCVAANADAFKIWLGRFLPYLWHQMRRMDLAAAGARVVEAPTGRGVQMDEGATGPRRWEIRGILATTLRNLWVLGLYAWGRPPAELARIYEGGA